jgi:hypothetical protein
LKTKVYEVYKLANTLSHKGRLKQAFHYYKGMFINKLK